MTKISVVMPNYNGAKWIRRSVFSVLNQSYENLELLVIDDGSDDDSVSILKKIGDPRVQIKRENHRGVCAARNLGISTATGKYIAFLDSDDTWEKEFLEELHRAIEGSPSAALAYCGWQNLGLPGRRSEPFLPPDYEKVDKLEKWLEGCRWPIHAALTRRDVVVEAGGFDERYPTAEDYYLWLRIVAKYPVVRVSKVLSYYHHHEGTRATHDRAKLAINHWQVQRKYLSDHPALEKTIDPDLKNRLTHGQLLQRGYAAYWDGDLPAARKIFRVVMRQGYGSGLDWLHMLPSLVPARWHATIAHFGSRRADRELRRRGKTGIP